MEASFCCVPSSSYFAASALLPVSSPPSSCACVNSTISAFQRSSRLNPLRKSAHPSWKAINAIPANHDHYTVGEYMTRKEQLLVAKTTTTVDEALDLLVQNRITGLPVVDESGKVIGVVSDFDLLALDTISGNRTSDSSLFPEAGSTWKAFKEIQTLVSKTHGKTVGEVMTRTPLVVQENSSLEDAARVLFETQKRRLPVVDDNGKLVGLLTRGNVIKAALRMKRDSDMDCESS